MTLEKNNINKLDIPRLTAKREVYSTNCRGMFPFDLKVKILLRIKLARKPATIAAQLDEIYQSPAALLRIKKTIYSRTAAVRPTAAYLASCGVILPVNNLPINLFPLNLPEKTSVTDFTSY